ncbi:MAG: hypothetical protein ACO1OB_30310 [Archangium sp.]
MHLLVIGLLAATSGQPGALTSDELAAVVSKKQADWEKCFELKRADDPIFVTSIVLRLSVKTDGSVGKAVVEQDYVGGEVGACVVEGVKKLKFPARLVPTESPYVFRFRPPDQQASYAKGETLLKTLNALTVNCRAAAGGNFVKLVITIEPNGQVSSVAAGETNLDARTVKCVVGRAEELTIPSYSAPVMRLMNLVLEIK